MAYVKSTGPLVHEYPLYAHEICERFPNVSFAIPFTPPDGYAEVVPVSQPATTPTHKYVEVNPVYSEGKFYQTWEAVLLTNEELASRAETLQITVVNATQARLDVFARTRNYDGILSACTYATSSVTRFKSDADYCVSARDNTWAVLYEILAEVVAGTRQIPSGFSEIEPLLPVLSWPA